MSIDTVPNTSNRSPAYCRADAYALLAALLRGGVEKDLLSIIQHADCPPEVPEAFKAAWDGLRNASSLKTVEGVANEFNELFGAAGRGAVVPYASWYQEGLLMGRALARLRRDLGHFGIQRREDSPEPEDHAALLCETMSLLNCRDDIPKDAYIQFFEQNVASWMFAFFSDVQNASQAGYYKCVCLLGTRLLQWETADKGA